MQKLTITIEIDFPEPITLGEQSCVMHDAVAGALRYLSDNGLNKNIFLNFNKKVLDNGHQL